MAHESTNHVFTAIHGLQMCGKTTGYSNGNLLKSLSLALHTPTCTCTCSNSNGEIGDYTQTQESLLTEAGNVINDIIHEKTKRTSNDITDLTNFSLDESIENTNSLLWNFVCLCTRSKRE